MEIRYFDGNTIKYEDVLHSVFKYPNFLAIPIISLSKFTGNKLCSRECDLDLGKNNLVINPGLLSNSDFYGIPRCEHTYGVFRCDYKLVVKVYPKITLFIKSYIIYSRHTIYNVSYDQYSRNKRYV